jgi:hypothetical protein
MKSEIRDLEAEDSLHMLLPPSARKRLHGRVIPLPGGVRARCFGPPRCRQCCLEEAWLAAIKTCSLIEQELLRE